MATATETPQTPAKCQFCEDSTDVCCKCLNCNLFLCQLCSNKIHSKLESSKAHQVIDLTDFGIEEFASSHRQFDLDHMTCTIHKGQKCMSYCCKCAKTICFKCFKESHSDHKLEDMHEIYMDRISKMKDLREVIKNDLPFFKAEKMKLQQSLANTTRSHNEVTDKILAKEKVLKDAVTKYAQDLLQRSDSIYKPTEVKIKNELSTIQKNEDELIKRKDDLDQVFTSRKASEVLDQSKTLEKMSHEKTESKITIPHAEFLHGEIQDINLSRIFGDLYNIDGLKLVQTYQTDVESVMSIVHVDDNHIFIGCKSSQKLQKVRIKNDSMTIVKEEDIKVIDMAMMDNGNIAISSFNSELRQYTKDGTLKSYKDFSPLVTTGVHVNKHKEILVGLVELGTIDIKANSIRKIVVLNQAMEIIHTYENDRSNKRLFTMLWRIITSNDNIYVADILNSNGEGRLVVLGDRGQVKWIYTGGDRLKSNTDKFYPGGITVTTSGLILISDFNNHSIHVLNQTGGLVFCHQVKTLGIELPYTLTIDVSGFLWVGCTTYNTKEKTTQRAKIYKLNFN